MPVRHRRIWGQMGGVMLYRGEGFQPRERGLTALYRTD